MGILWRLTDSKDPECSQAPHDEQRMCATASFRGAAPFLADQQAMLHLFPTPISRVLDAGVYPVCGRIRISADLRIVDFANPAPKLPRFENSGNRWTSLPGAQ